MRILAAISFVLLLVFQLSGQDEKTGTLNIYADPRIDSLLELHIAYNEAFPVIEGYRIHIFMESGNDALMHAEEELEKFKENYEDIPVYITFGEPYYRVRVGDFRTRLEANHFLQSISSKYPHAWVIKDMINLPSLPKNQ